MAKSTTPDPTEKKPAWRTYLFPGIVVVLAIVAVIAVIIVRGGGDDKPASSGQQMTAEEYRSEDQAGSDEDGDEPQDEEAKAAEELMASLPEKDPKDKLATGEPNAPVQMIVYSDFQCPYCAQWAKSTLPMLIKDYVDKGDLRIEFREANVFGDDSVRAARAAAAAGEQDGHMKYYQKLFENGKKRSPGDLKEDKLVEMAEDVGLDDSKLRSDMKSKKVTDLVQDHEDQAMELGVTSTPSFIVGTQATRGAQPAKHFKELVEDELSKKDSDKGSQGGESN